MMLRRTVLVLLASAVSLAPAASAESPAGDAFFDSRGVRIRYVDVGRGEPVVLIHGFSSSLDVNWGQTKVIDTLAKDFRVIALDVRGHGRSGKPHDPASYCTVVVDDVIRLLDHLGLAKAHIVGYSMGGVITGKLIVTHPERAISAVFGASAPRVGWPAQADKDSTAIAESLVRAIRLPLLAIVGSADPIKAGVDTFKLVPRDLAVVVIDGATHSGIRGAAGRQEFPAAVRDFIAAHRSASDR